jgi:hypothetical protein
MHSTAAVLQYLQAVHVGAASAFAPTAPHKNTSSSRVFSTSLGKQLMTVVTTTLRG